MSRIKIHYLLRSRLKDDSRPSCTVYIFTYIILCLIIHHTHTLNFTYPSLVCISCFCSTPQRHRRPSIHFVILFSFFLLTISHPYFDLSIANDCSHKPTTFFNFERSRNETRWRSIDTVRVYHVAQYSAALCFSPSVPPGGTYVIYIPRYVPIRTSIWRTPDNRPKCYISMRTDFGDFRPLGRTQIGQKLAFSDQNPGP
ncbi:hypothetical protein BYT27DRAFT_6360818 [Phlegmacium glaucopus]|nr:hypothetical protein BYT27DRAFT_6360818 [Phlegmacium glaucopus]